MKRAKKPGDRRGTNPNSLKNLKPIAPGEVRNPLGINRNRPYSDAYLATSEEPIPEAVRARFNKILGKNVVPEGTTWAQAISLRLHLSAVVDGDVRSAEELANQVQGEPSKRIEVTGGGGSPLAAPNLEVHFVSPSKSHGSTPQPDPAKS